MNAVINYNNTVVVLRYLYSHKDDERECVFIPFTIGSIFSMIFPVVKKDAKAEWQDYLLLLLRTKEVCV